MKARPTLYGQTLPRLYPNQVYDVANQRYWGGKLPKVNVRFVDLGEAVMGRTLAPRKNTGNPKHIVIQLSKRFRTQSVIWIGTLIHEMVHVELWGRRVKDHGYVFQRRMKELVNAGAYKDLI